MRLALMVKQRRLVGSVVLDVFDRQRMHGREISVPSGNARNLQISAQQRHLAWQFLTVVGRNDLSVDRSATRASVRLHRMVKRCSSRRALLAQLIVARDT
jgi:hypothetical protein